MNLSGSQFEFPFKVHALLDDVEREGLGDVVSWFSHGRAFRIHSSTEFAASILPKYFGDTKYKSFQRQLNIYGFRRIADKLSPEFGAYYHKLFVRGGRELSLQMTRHKIKGNGIPRVKGIVTKSKCGSTPSVVTSKRSRSYLVQDLAVEDTLSMVQPVLESRSKGSILALLERALLVARSKSCDERGKEQKRGSSPSKNFHEEDTSFQPIHRILEHEDENPEERGISNAKDLRAGEEGFFEGHRFYFV